MVEIWKICGFHAELQFPLAKFFKFSLNVFEATISHMVLIINELHFVPFTLPVNELSFVSDYFRGFRDLCAHSDIFMIP
jgi:hypothetical protein